MTTTSYFSTSNTSTIQSFPDDEILKNSYVEIPFLMIVIVVGTCGNIMVIAAVKVERKLRINGMAFIVNLAVADLVITAWYLPIVLANCISNYTNVLQNVWGLCAFNAYVSALCCEVSMMTLTLIAFNRFMKVVHPHAHSKFLASPRQIGTLLALVWLECVLVALPVLVGWFGSEPLVHFDPKMMACMWNDERTNSYNVFLVVAAIFLPIAVTAFCYYKVFTLVKKSKKSTHQPMSNFSKTTSVPSEPASNNRNRSGDQLSPPPTPPTALTPPPAVRTHHSRTCSFSNHVTRRTQRAEERERRLMATLLVVVVFYVLFWMPYGLMTLIDPTSNALAKRACGWLALSNSAINSIIYGLLNANFRQGYVTLLRKTGCLCSGAIKIVCCPVRRRPEAEAEYKPQTVTFG